MNGIVKAVFRVNSCVKSANFVNSVFMSRGLTPVKRDFTRSIWHTCSSRQTPLVVTTKALENLSNTCSCGCGAKGIHTKGERELVEFLTEEIVAERKAQKVKTLPTEIEGFKVKGDRAEVVLTKQSQDETINITFNVNHTVDSNEVAEEEQTSQGQEFAEMRSQPQFEVDIVRGDQTLGFTCSFIEEGQTPEDGEDYNDIFGIDEVTIYKGEWNEKVYAVAGDVLDGYLYDLLMNLLEEKGISNDFAKKLSDFSTGYEHSQYINLLETVSRFTTGK